MARSNNNRNKGNNKKPQLFLLPVNDLPDANSVKNGKEVFKSLLKKIDDQMATTSKTKPSDIIKKTFEELNPYQQYIFLGKISDKDIEKLKDIADKKISSNPEKRLKNFLKLSKEIEPVEFTGRVFCTIDHLLKHETNNDWLRDFKTQLEKDEKLLMKLSLRMANFTPVEAINFIKCLDYYFKIQKINEVL